MRKLYKLTLLLIVILLGNNVFAYDFSAVCSVGQTLYYNITSSEEPYTVEVTSENIEYPYYTTYPTGNLEIPESVEYNSITYSVTRIGDKAFYNCSGITTVTIPNSVTSIGNHAFYCRELTSVIIPNSVISIGENAFSGCGRLTAVYYTGDVAGWCEIFFLSTSSNPLLYAHNLYINNELVIDLVIPETVTEIKNYAFYYATSLTSVIIPNSVTSIGSYAFHDCSGLETIVVESGNSIYDSRDNCNAIIETESNILLVGCKNTIIPNTVTSIGSSAFFDCSGLVSITIPESVTSIGEWAFANCSGLTGSLTIPNSVSSIGDEAFYGCIGFSGVLTISSSVTSIGYSAFYGCGGFENIVVESGNSIYDSRDNCNALIETELNTLLIGCKNTVIPNTVTSISDYAFYNCSGLTSATIPNSVTSIGNSAFEGCTGLIEVTIPDSVTNIGNDAFSGCTGLTTINYNAINCTFDYSAWGMDISLATLNIGENVTNIPDNAFTRLSGIDTVNFNATNCTRMGSESQPVFSHELETLIIGENVTNIPEYAFYNYGNINISIVKFNATNCTSFGRNNGITGNGNISDLIIGENVTNIPDSAFSGCTGLGGGEFVIPNSVTVIGEYAFYGCYGLNGDLTIPNTMTSIGKYAFYGCSGLYGSLTIPNSVTSIGEYTFKDCGVTDITISDSVTSIGNSAFSGCSNLFYVSFNAANCTIMGNSSNPVFGDCPNMTTLYIGENVKNIPNYAFYGCTGLTEITIPDSVTNIGAQAFYNCSGCEVLTIGKSVETIGTDAFSGCNFSTLNYNAANCSSTPFANNTNITSLSIGDGVENIPDEAFSSCTEISGTLIIPSSVTSIGTRAFYRCTSLSSLSLPEYITTISDGAFAYCNGLTGELVIPNSVITIGSEDINSYGAFWHCENLTSLTIGNSVEFIGKSTFQACSSLTSITIPESVTNIELDAFEGCSALTTFNFNAENCTTMGSRSNPAFANCPLFTTLNIGERVKSIPNSAFYGCTGLSEITIPDSVTNIGDYAFYGCSGLISAVIGESTTRIGAYAFNECSSLPEITIPDSVTYIGDRAFADCSTLATVNYNSKNCTYMGGADASAVFSDCTSFTTLNIGERVKSIPDFAFSECRNLTGTLIIPDSVTSIGFRSFYICRGLSSISIPESVTTIGDGAFAYCDGLTGELVIPNSVITIGDENGSWGAFWRCENLTSVTIGNSVETIGKFTFQACSSLTSITIPESVTSIYDKAFEACTALTTVNFNATNCTTMGSSSNPAFADCSLFDTLNIGERVKNIPDYAFYGCTGLTEITIPDSVTSIGDNAFYGCDNIADINMSANTPPELGDQAFTSTTYTTATLWTPCTADETYRNDSQWGQFTDIQNDTTPLVLTAQTADADMGSVAGSGNYSCETEATITATPNQGYRFLSWNDGNEDNPRTITVTKDSTFEAGFRAIHTITAIAGNGGSITPSGETTVDEGGSQSFTITPNECYEIASVMVDGEDVTADLVEGVYTFDNVTTGHTIYATFMQITYTIMASAGNGGTISPYGTAVVACGSDKAFSIVADNGYRISSVLVDGVEAVSELVEGAYTFTNITADHTIYATFDYITYELTIHYVYADNETAVDDHIEYLPEGATYSVISPEIYGYTADRLVVEGTMPANDVEETVYYNANSYTLTIHYVYADNSEAAADYTATVNYGVEYSVVSPEINGYTADQLIVEGTMPAEDVVFTVIYTINIYTITATAGDNGTITPSEITVEEGADANFTITPNDGYRIASVMVDGAENVTEQLVEGVYTFENVTADHTIYATFEEIPAITYTITATAGENGTISPSGEVTVVEGEDEAFVITPAEGYRIASVMVDVSENVTYQLVEGVYTFENVNANHTISATFEEVLLPVADFTTNPVATGGTLNILLGQRVEYTSTSLNAHHILWTFEGADTVESSQNYVPAVGYSEEGVFLTTLVAYNEDETITDTATLTVVVTATRSYTITVVSANEAYGTVTGGGTYEEGAEIVITATPNQGYRFVQWSDDNTENPRTITVTSDSIFIANFVREFADTITLIDYNGNTYDINALLDDDKYVVFDFFFTTDHYSQEEVPDAVALYTRMGCNGGEVIFIGLTMTNSFEPNTIEWYISEFGVTYPIAPLESNPINETLLNNWGVDGSPTYICISPDRSMRELNRPLNYEELVALGAHERDCSNYNTDVYWSCTFEEENPLYTVGQIITSDANWELQTKSDYTGENYFWAMNSTGENHPYGDISDTPDHWMMIDGGGANQDGYDFDSYMEFSGIDLSDAAGPMICFYECSRRFNIPPSMEATVIEVSTDGGATWTRHLVGCEEMNNDNIFAYRRVLIPEAANNSNVTIRFRANRQESVISNYFNNSPTYSDGIFIVHWQVDDITIEETPACDLSIQDARISMFGYIDYRNENALMSLNETRESAYHKYDPYAQSPRKQWTTGNGFAAFNVEVASIGYETVTPMVRIKITNPNGEEIYNKVASGIRPLSFTEGDTIDFASFDEESDSRIFFFEDNENIPIGRYTVDFYVFADGMEDADTTNNHTTQYFDITESTFSMSYNEPTTYSVLNTNSPEDKYGIKFSYNYDDFIQNAGNGNVVIEAYIDEHTSVGTMITGSLYTYQGGDIDDINSYLEDQLAGITIEEDMLGTWINLDIDENLPYMFAYEAYDTLPYTFIIAIGVTEGSLALGSSDVLTSKGNNSLLWSESPVSWNIYGAQLAIRVRELNEYTVNVISANDEYGSVSGGGTFMEGTEIYIYARPNQGYRFVSWNDVNTENPRAIIVTRDSTFVANFEAEPFQQYTITVLSNDEEYGTVTGGGTYDEGTTVTITAIPNIGYCFLTWSDGNMDNPREITVTGDRTYTAYFTASTHVAIDTTVTKYLTIGDRTFYVAGQYSFTIPSNEGCDTIVDLNLHILDEPEAYDISPNPAKSLISISSEKYISFVEFYSTSGRLVMRKEINAYSVEVNVEALMPGVYFVRLYGEDENLPSVQKFVKE